MTDTHTHGCFQTRVCQSGPVFSLTRLLRENRGLHRRGERSVRGVPAGNGTFRNSEEVAVLQTQVARQRSSVLSVMTLLCQVVANVRRKWNLLKAEEEIKEGRLLFLFCRTVSFGR